MEWILEQDESDLFLSAATLMEIRYGIEKKAAGRKREELEDWLVNKLPLRFLDRIIPVERHVADLAGRILRQAEIGRRGTDEMDSLIAASAMANDMGLATLNRKHFEWLAVELANF